MNEVVEFDGFAQWADRHLSAEELSDLRNVLAFDPTQGVLIPRGGGARKIRTAVGKRGKSGGGRG